MFKPDTIIQGDVLEKVKEIPDESIDCIVTSPPYWGLRDYGVAGQWGLEPTFHEWIKKMLQLTAELKRVLKKTGVCWIDIGDTYASDGKVGGDIDLDPGMDINRGRGRIIPGTYQTKCLCMIPERLALGIIDQGWILRNKIIWHKPNAMPASVTDRFKNSYEIVYMFSKQKKYWFDLDSVRVPMKESTINRLEYSWDTSKISKGDMYGENKIGQRAKGNRSLKEINLGMKAKKQDNVPSKNANLYKGFNERCEVQGSNIAGANPGDVWTIATQPFSEAHFATFPEKLIEPMIRASCPREVCVKCGFIRERIIKHESPQMGVDIPADFSEESFAYNIGLSKNSGLRSTNKGEWYKWKAGHPDETIGWTSCKCNVEFKAGIVLDPFFGSGTVGVVAQKLNRHWLGIELKQEYIQMALDRIYKKSTPITQYMK